MPRELPRRVVAVDQMSDDEFAMHCALRHPALKKRLRTRDGTWPLTGTGRTRMFMSALRRTSLSPHPTRVRCLWGMSRGRDRASGHAGP